MAKFRETVETETTGGGSVKLKSVLIWLVCLAVAWSAMTFTARGQAYTRLTGISLPNLPPAKGNFSYDIGGVDPRPHPYYLADRTNKGIHTIDTTTNKYFKKPSAGQFEG